MSAKEIYFWMKVFCNKNQSFIHGERKISLFTVFNYLLELKKENQELQERINKAIEYIKIYKSYQKIDNKDYLKGRDEIGCLDICQVDELLDILKEVE